jgi:hypothetical protein
VIDKQLSCPQNLTISLAFRKNHLVKDDFLNNLLRKYYKIGNILIVKGYTFVKKVKVFICRIFFAGFYTRISYRPCALDAV